MTTKEEPAWIDISVALKTGAAYYPGDPPVEVSRLSGEGKESVVSHLSLGAHAGTHVDAPRHFIPEGLTIDRVPAEAMIGPARVIAIADPNVITPAELQNYPLSRGDRILLKTRNSALWQSDSFAADYVHLSTEAAGLLAGAQVAVVGIDYLSVGGFQKNESEVHRALLEAGVWIIEGLDLRAVRPGWYDLICLPLLIPGAEAAPARAMVRRRPIVP